MTQVLYIKGYGQQVWDGFNAGVIWYMANDAFNTPRTSALEIEIVTGAENPTATPLGQFNNIANALDYYASSKCPGLVTTCNAPYGSTYYTSYVMEKMDHPIQEEFNALATVSRTGDYNDLINKPSGGSRSFANPTVALNTAAQISTTRDAQVSYSVDISCSMSLTGGQSGTTILEYADDSGFTTNVKTVAKGTNANSGALTIGLSLVNLSTVSLSGIVPANKYRRIRSVNNTGTPSFVLQNAQEVLL